ncbi:hypothetical protein B0T26DRAFT_681853 [Lasiosphaeria miniovina]|uniref:Uncharacterized protein n=1 Tax=Lasiosphaeria miniovina TaxID=1954250 RepID=A0AA40DG27_9PEZI|nr:uncharacterized protein B0T26DRAFT_681853 [Lasiosphaeria miniovina]KAK0701735.1 hypothetical protein B0T26DRAFT_681853 [Lasiosphaeria miniovina]
MHPQGSLWDADAWGSVLEIVSGFVDDHPTNIMSQFFLFGPQPFHSLVPRNVEAILSSSFADYGFGVRADVFRPSAAPASSPRRATSGRRCAPCCAATSCACTYIHQLVDACVAEARTWTLAEARTRKLAASVSPGKDGKGGDDGDDGDNVSGSLIFGGKRMTALLAWRKTRYLGYRGISMLIEQIIAMNPADNDKAVRSQVLNVPLGGRDTTAA